MQVDLDTRHIWDSYLQSCVVQKTHAIGKLKGQIATQGISLKNYFLSYPGVVALCDLLAPMGAVNRLRSLELINNNLRGSGIKGDLPTASVHWTFLARASICSESIASSCGEQLTKASNV